MLSYWLHRISVKYEGYDPVIRFNNTSWVAVVIPTDRPKSVRNRCVMEVSLCFLEFSVG